MNLTELTECFSQALVLLAIELIEAETSDGATESDIASRIEMMDEEEWLEAAAMAVWIMKKKRPEITPTDIDSEVLADEISDFLSEQDD